MPITCLVAGVRCDFMKIPHHACHRGARQGLCTRIAYDQIRRNHMIVRKVSTAEGAPSRRFPPHDVRAGHRRPGWCVSENS